ncbi:MAG: TIGR03915 family putative DNA repair protein [Chitinophagaceae bacterium]
MQLLVYDGSFAGWLTVVFEVYEYKFNDVCIRTQAHAQPNAFGDTRVVETDTAKAARVWKGLQQKISANAASQLYKSFLSELPSIEDAMLRYARYVFQSKTIVECDYSHPDILMVQQTSRKVHREKHRMEAFVRFQLTSDQLYYAVVQPDFNVLPLIIRHFQTRYADQRWLIYDLRRRYGIYYDLKQVTTVDITFNENTSSGENISAVYDETEPLYQMLWQQYFSSVNIAARKNTKLHVQHMPKRYWRYLTEKLESL